MIPPRRPTDLPYSASSQSGAAFPSTIPELHLGGSSQQQSRLLGQEEQNVMLALGLVRAASSALLALEPKLLRASELLLRIEAPREAAATRVELGKLYDELSRAVASAVFEGRVIFESASAVFDVDDAQRNGEPLTVGLPDLQSVLYGERGLEQFLTRARVRGDVERMADALVAASADGKAMLVKRSVTCRCSSRTSTHSDASTCSAESRSPTSRERPRSCAIAYRTQAMLR